MDAPAWLTYQRVAACFELEAASIEVSVTPNASLLYSSAEGRG
jgi:hypothetical protein